MLNTNKFFFLRIYWMKKWDSIEDKTFYLLINSFSKLPTLEIISLSLNNNSITQNGLISIQPLMQKNKFKEIHLSLEKLLLNLR